MARILTLETSLSRKRQSLLKESAALRRLVRIELAVAAVGVVAGIPLWLLYDRPVLLEAGVLLAALAGGHVLKVRQNASEERHVQWGLEGERKVTGLLNELLDKSHFIINDFKVQIGRRTAQIDHLVISPRGLFAIETKNWGGHVEGDENEDTWTQQGREGRPPMPRHNPIKQVRRHVEFLQGKLEQNGINWPDVKGLLVFTSPKATHYVHNATMEILTPREVALAITRSNGSRLYTEDEVSAVVNLFMRGTE